MSNEPRTIVLEGEEVKEELKEDETQKFVAWRCSEFLKDGPTLVEVGYIEFTGGSAPDYSGFILFDGSDSGVLALYRRKGLERVWNWGPELKYQFNLHSDGNGFYYDFTGTKEGEKIKASQLFTCGRKSS